MRITNIFRTRSRAQAPITLNAPCFPPPPPFPPSLSPSSSTLSSLPPSFPCSPSSSPPLPGSPSPSSSPLSPPMSPITSYLQSLPPALPPPPSSTSPPPQSTSFSPPPIQTSSSTPPLQLSSAAKSSTKASTKSSTKTSTTITTNTLPATSPAHMVGQQQQQVNGAPATMNGSHVGVNVIASFFHSHVGKKKMKRHDGCTREGYDSAIAKLKVTYWDNYRLDVAADRGMSLSDFEGLKTIGTGSFGTVKVGKLKSTGEVFAIKILGKHRIMRANQVQHTISEKRILRSMDFPFIVKAFHHFSDNANLYMVMEYCPGGELFKLIQRYNFFSETMAKFYGAQVVMAFEFLHEVGVIYRDLKPENILIDAQGYIKLVDFGLAKETRASTHTMCGTPDYLAPEMLQGKSYDKSVDWWALGVLLFEMVAGYIPYYAETNTESYAKILTKKVFIPVKFSKELGDLVRHLLKKDPKCRLGCTINGAKTVKMHSWFDDVSWLKILEKKVIPPYVPVLKSDMDTSNFDPYEDVEIDSAPFCVYYNNFAAFY